MFKPIQIEKITNTNVLIGSRLYQPTSIYKLSYATGPTKYFLNIDNNTAGASVNNIGIYYGGIIVIYILTQ